MNVLGLRSGAFKIVFPSLGIIWQMFSTMHSDLIISDQTLIDLALEDEVAMLSRNVGRQQPGYGTQYKK